MIDLKDLREHPDQYRRAALEGIAVDIDRVLHIDADRIRHQQEFERLRADQNEASRQIGALKDSAGHRAGGGSE